jgi:hypothetical protein
MDDGGMEEAARLFFSTAQLLIRYKVDAEE